MKALLFRSVAVAALCYSTAAVAQTTHTLAEDAAAFGARERVVAARLSPDGASVMYLTPGPGAKTFAELFTRALHAVTLFGRRRHQKIQQALFCVA